MTPQQFRSFVERYSQRFQQVRKSAGPPGGETLAAQDGTGSKRLQQGRTLDQQVLDVKGAEKLSPDELRKLYESRARSVSPEYRKQVEEYFRSISEGAAPRTPTTAPSQ